LASRPFQIGVAGGGDLTAGGDANNQVRHPWNWRRCLALHRHMLSLHLAHPYYREYWILYNEARLYYALAVIAAFPPITSLLVLTRFSFGYLAGVLFFLDDTRLRSCRRYGAPEIFNTDQGSQFTSTAFTGVLVAAGIAISMDGRGRWMDNVFIERLWRSLKHEDIYLKGYADGGEARAGIAAWLEFYNHRRLHQALGCQTPDGLARRHSQSSRHSYSQRDR
jgi:hypothetical protein